MITREHLQLLILMIPTLLLLVAAVVTLVAAGNSVEDPVASRAAINQQEVAAVDTGIGPMPTVVIH